MSSSTGCMSGSRYAKYSTSGSWSSRRNIVTISKRRPNPDEGPGYLVATNAYPIKEFLKNQLNFRYKYPENPNKEWVSGSPLSPAEITNKINQIREECAKKSVELSVAPGTLNGTSTAVGEAVAAAAAASDVTTTSTVSATNFTSNNCAKINVNSPFHSSSAAFASQHAATHKDGNRYPSSSSSSCDVAAAARSPVVISSSRPTVVVHNPYASRCVSNSKIGGDGGGAVGDAHLSKLVKSELKPGRLADMSRNGSDNVITGGGTTGSERGRSTAPCTLTQPSQHQVSLLQTPAPRAHATAAAAPPAAVVATGTEASDSFTWSDDDLATDISEREPVLSPPRFVLRRRLSGEQGAYPEQPAMPTPTPTAAITYILELVNCGMIYSLRQFLTYGESNGSSRNGNSLGLNLKWDCEGAKYITPSPLTRTEVEEKIESVRRRCRDDDLPVPDKPEFPALQPPPPDAPANGGVFAAAAASGSEGGCCRNDIDPSLSQQTLSQQSFGEEECSPPDTPPSPGHHHRLSFSQAAVTVNTPRQRKERCEDVVTPDDRRSPITASRPIIGDGGNGGDHQSRKRDADHGDVLATPISREDCTVRGSSGAVGDGAAAADGAQGGKRHRAEYNQSMGGGVGSWPVRKLVQSCGEPNTWISFDFAPEPTRPRFLPGGGDGKMAALVPHVLPVLEVKVGGGASDGGHHDATAVHVLECLLRGGGVMEGLLAWREVTQVCVC